MCLSRVVERRYSFCCIARVIGDDKGSFHWLRSRWASRTAATGRGRILLNSCSHDFSSSCPRRYCSWCFSLFEACEIFPNAFAMSPHSRCPIFFFPHLFSILSVLSLCFLQSFWLMLRFRGLISFAITK